MDGTVFKPTQASCILCVCAYLFKENNKRLHMGHDEDKS